MSRAVSTTTLPEMPCSGRILGYARSLLFLAVLVASPCYCRLDQFVMSKPQHCPGKVIAAAHRFLTVSAWSAVECVSLCKPHDRCVSVVFERDQHLCHLGNATVANVGCAAMETAIGNTVYYEEMSAVAPVECQNGGIPSPDYANCSCPAGYHGDACDSTFEDCDDYLALGQLNSKAVRWIKPPSLPAVPVLCQKKVGISSEHLARTYILTRKDGAADFNRSWVEYRDGFGDPGSSTHWLGWEKIRAMTSTRPYYLRISLKNPALPENIYGTSNNFTVRFDAAAGGYILSYTTVYQFDDCFLEDVKNVAFSAYDVDNDGSTTVNCAALYGGGWWFKGDNCSSCNPFGPILAPYDGTLKGGTLAEGVLSSSDYGNVVPFEMTMYLIRGTQANT